MHVDSILHDVSFQKSYSVVESQFLTIINASENDLIKYNIVANFMTPLNVTWNINIAKQEISISRVDFFRAFDIIALMSNIVWGLEQSEIYLDDIQAFRPRIGATARATVEILLMLKQMGLNDTNTFINNYFNTIVFKLDVFMNLIKLFFNFINRFIEYYECTYNNWIRYRNI